ncbi:hypothetical protein EJB05_55722, partial [Eragrostis curvula]
MELPTPFARLTLLRAPSPVRQTRGSLTEFEVKATELSPRPSSNPSSTVTSAWISRPPGFLSFDGARILASISSLLELSSDAIRLCSHVIFRVLDIRLVFAYLGLRVLWSVSKFLDILEGEGRA